MPTYRYPSKSSITTNYRMILFEEISFKNSLELDDVSGARRISNDLFIKNHIYLEMPSSIDISESHSWEQQDILAGSMGKIAAESARDWAVGLAQGISNLMPGDNTGTNILNKATGSAALSRGVNYLANPHKAIIYSGTAQRDILFEIPFYAENISEAKEIIKIINIFKEGSRGKMTESVGIKSPDVWHIKVPILEERGNEVIQELADLGTIPFALVSINLSINSKILYHQKYPVHVQGTLRFQEIAPRYAGVQDYNL